MGHLNNDDDKSLFKGFTVPRKSRILTDVAALLFAGDTMLLHRSATQNKSHSSSQVRDALPFKSRSQTAKRNLCKEDRYSESIQSHRKAPHLNDVNQSKSLKDSLRSFDKAFYRVIEPVVSLQWKRTSFTLKLNLNLESQKMKRIAYMKSLMFSWFTSVYWLSPFFCASYAAAACFYMCLLPSCSGSRFSRSHCLYWINFI